jgi:uncharacterized repeat protein (TIGR01451 family)
MNLLTSIAGAAGIAACALVLAAGSGSAQEEQDPCSPELQPASVQELPFCAIDVTKSLTSASPAVVGGTMTFQITITNTGMAPLTSVALADAYDSSLIHFVSASPSPDAFIEDPVDGGALLWMDLLPSPDGGLTGVWDSGESLTVTVNFTALAPDTHENCSFADATLFIGEGSTEIGPITEACEPYHIIAAPTSTPRSGGGGGSSSRRPTSTPTDVPPSTPVPVSTVAPATVVPVRTVVPVGIAAPDTGTGDGLGGSTNTIELLIVLLAGTAGIAGATVLRRSMR